MKIEKTKGSLILKEITFTQFLERRVNKNNSTSGKVSLPKELIGKKIYVIIPEND